MNGFLTENFLFRWIYCSIASNDSCVMQGYDSGLLSASWSWLAFLVAAVVMGFIALMIALNGTLAFLWIERRLLARFQSRVGPNRWGPFGLLTPIADAIKILFKEDIVPKEADRTLFNLAPVLAMTSALLVFGFIPFGEGFFVVSLSVGLVFVLGITSLNVLATLMAGWASSNRISIFSTLRAGAILISYEIPSALSLIGVIMISGTLSLNGIVEAQVLPFILVQPLAFFIFMATSLAEVNRTPFDLTEAESELGAGHLNDYSSMKFGLLFIAEYTATIAASAIIATLFLGGWRGFDFLPGPIWFLIKTVGVLFVINWLRSTWPRLRVDQILQLAWKGLFELALINIVVTAILITIFPQPTFTELLIIAGVNWGVFILVLVLIDRIMKRSRKKRAAQLGFGVYPVAPSQVSKENI